MRSFSFAPRLVAWTLGIILFAPPPASAQLIPVKTVPLAAGDQFLIFPSARLSMGGVSVALADSLLDPFVNPATGYRTRDPRLISAPTIYNVFQSGGTSARTMPVGVLLGSRTWFGGGVLALQQLGLRGPSFYPGLVLAADATVAQTATFASDLLSQKSRQNRYAFGFLGRTVPGTRIAVAASGFWSDLSALDGVQMLYDGNVGIDQYGWMGDVRLGVAADLPGNRAFEAVLLHHRLSMTHDVTYARWVPQSPPLPWVYQTSQETNLDRSNTWGMHLGYRRPLAGNGWRIGGIVTLNRKLHPEIPNYSLQNIPRDPGDSWAGQVGVGVSQFKGQTVFAIDLIYEPIWSHTWGTAAAPLRTARGDTIPAGGRAVDNTFRFSNSLFRIGVAQELGTRVSFQLGLEMHSFFYRLKQRDLAADSTRRQTENWIEWTPSWGVTATFSNLELRYAGRVVTGTGWPGVASSGGGFIQPLSSGDFVIAPSGPLTLTDAPVVTHQISLQLPL